MSETDEMPLTEYLTDLGYDCENCGSRIVSTHPSFEPEGGCALYHHDSVLQAKDREIAGLYGTIESQKQTNEALLKRIQAAMRYMEFISPDIYKLSGVWNILNRGK